MAHKSISRTSDSFVESCNIEADTASIVSTLLDCEIASEVNERIGDVFSETTPRTTVDESDSSSASSADYRSPLIDKYYEDFQASDTDSDSDDDNDITEDDGDDIGAVFAEVREMYKCDNLPDYTKNVSRDVAIDDVEEIVDTLPETDMDSEGQTKVKSCANCSTKERVLNAKSLKKGQHITFPGHYFTFRCGKKLRKIYHHHAIVKQIKKASEQKVELVLIHFTKVGKEINIHETTEVYNLANDEISIVEYKRPRYEADEIVRRAESMLPKNFPTSNKRRYRKFRRYNLLTRNCEHFASWCVLGAEESFEVKSLRKTIAKLLSKSAGVGCKIGRFIKRFLYNSADEIATKFSSFNTNCLPGIVLGFTVIVYLIYCIVFTIKLFSKYKKGEMCKVCFKREVITLWTHFGAFIATSGISYLIVYFLLPLITPTPIGIPLLLVIVLLSLAMQWGIGKIRKALMSPFACDRSPVVRLSDLNCGNMITFKYFGFEHFAIVTEVHEESEDSTVGKIRCVHYGLKSLNVMRKREVIEEFIPVDIEKGSKKLKMVECKHLNSYPSHEVVKRARERVGERNWGPWSNRSDHLCFWALVKNDNESEIDGKVKGNMDNIGETKTKHKSSLCVGQTEVHTRKEVMLGDVVKYDGIVGILVALDDIKQCEAKKFDMEVVIYKRLAKRVKKTVDLREKRMFVKKYHPAHCCSMDERVQRACEKEDKKCEFWFANSFFEYCVMKSEQDLS